MFHATNWGVHYFPFHNPPVTRPYQTPEPLATRLERACGCPLYRGYGVQGPWEAAASAP